MAGGSEALAGFVFREQAVMDGAFAGVVDLVGDAGEVGVDPGEFEVVIDLVEQVAQGGGVAVAGADHAGELRRELLLDSFFKDGAAHDGAGGVVDNFRKDAAELMDAVGAGELGDGIAEAAAGRIGGGHGKELLLEMGDVDGHGTVRLGNRVRRLEWRRSRKQRECVGAGFGNGTRRR